MQKNYLVPLHLRYLPASGPCGGATQLLGVLLALVHGLFALPKGHQLHLAALAVGEGENGVEALHLGERRCQPLSGDAPQLVHLLGKAFQLAYSGVHGEAITHPRPLHRSRAGVLQDPTQSLQVTNVTGMGTDARASSGDPGSVSVDVPRSRGPTCRRGHNTFSRYYQSVMYAELRTFETIRKKPCRIGPGLCGTSENSSSTSLAEMLTS